MVQKTTSMRTMYFACSTYSVMDVFDSRSVVYPVCCLLFCKFLLLTCRSKKNLYLKRNVILEFCATFRLHEILLTIKQNLLAILSSHCCQLVPLSSQSSHACRTRQSSLFVARSNCIAGAVVCAEETTIIAVVFDVMVVI